jgi:hypothetical protein
VADDLQELLAEAKREGIVQFNEVDLQWAKPAATAEVDLEVETEGAKMAEEEEQTTRQERDPRKASTEQEAFSNRIFFERKTQKARKKWMVSSKRFEQQLQSIDEIKAKLQEAEAELEQQRQAVDMWQERYKDSNLQFQDASDTHRRMVELDFQGKERKEATAASKPARDLASGIWEDLEACLETELKGITKQEEVDDEDKAPRIRKHIEEAIQRVLEKNRILAAAGISAQPRAGASAFAQAASLDDMGLSDDDSQVGDDWPKDGQAQPDESMHERRVLQEGEGGAEPSCKHQRRSEG